MNWGFWKGFIIGCLTLVIIGGLIVPYIGPFNMSVTSGKGILDWWGNTNLMHSFKWYAPDEKIPKDINISQAQHHYQEMCLRCHGAPGVGPEKWSQQMLPKPPPVWVSTRNWSDGDIFYVIKDGIKMTGMPSWKEGHTDKEIWNMVAFIRKMGEMDEETKKKFKSHMQKVETHKH